MTAIDAVIQAQREPGADRTQAMHAEVCMGEDMVWETMDEEWTGREAVDKVWGETADEASGDREPGETADDTLETMDGTAAGTWEDSMEATRDEEVEAAVSGAWAGKKKSCGRDVRDRKKKPHSPAARAGQQIEGRHIKMLLRELLPYVILAACMGIMVSGALAFRRARTERMGWEVRQEYEEQFLHE